MQTHPITECKAPDGRTYFAYRNLKFSTREVAERHADQAAANMARFRAAVAADTPEQRAANIRAILGIKAEG